MEKHVDLLIVGAGISGLALRHISKNCPQRSFEIIERRDSFGGTWDLFKYPGIRSDSDMSTLVLILNHGKSQCFGRWFFD
jgi:cyclohexanone monooxygenase